MSHVLTIEKYHLSKEKATKAVIKALQDYGVQKSAKIKWDQISISLHNQSINTTYKFSDLVKEVRLTGIIELLQQNQDNNDDIFGGTLTLATPNDDLKVRVQYAGYDKEFKGAFRGASAFKELTEDILFYRKQSCEYSNCHDFSLTCRYYRAYLLSCISLIESFINRHIFLSTYEGCTSADFERLRNTLNLEDKISLWLKVYTSKDISAINKTKAWDHFMRLRKERNILTHVLEPDYAHEIKEIAKYLNYCQSGIGCLLFLLRENQKKITLGFIERLKTAPKVTYHKRFLK